METKLLAVLLTDISGYTEFSYQAERTSLEAAVRQQQKIILPVIQRFHGRLVKWIGDAALAVFGSATDAVLCGHNIQMAFVEQAERSPAAIGGRIKIVVHAGDVMVDDDGDVYGSPVNFASRMEKASEATEVYFSETVRQLIPVGEIPHEFIGEFEFKGITEKAKIYRTCFGHSPVVRERVVLVQTNFVGVGGLAERYGWDNVHPVLDRTTGIILAATRLYGGTPFGTLQVGAFLTFEKASAALNAIRTWNTELNVSCANLVTDTKVAVRVGLHWGTLHVMRHTMMGRDIDVTRALAALSFGQEVLLTDQAVRIAASEGVREGLFMPTNPHALRQCRSKDRWLNRYNEMKIFSVTYDVLEKESYFNESKNQT